MAKFRTSAINWDLEFFLRGAILVLFGNGNSRLLLVGPGVELGKEDEEGDHVGRADDALDDGEATVVVDTQQEAVAKHREELKHLQGERGEK